MRVKLNDLFEGFRFIKERPLIVLGWAAIYAVILGVCLYYLLSSAFSSFNLLQENVENNTSPLMNKMMEMQLFSQLLNLVFMVTEAIFVCGMYRTTLKSYEGGLMFMKFGFDELRFILTRILTHLIIYVPLIFIFVIIAVVVATNQSGNFIYFHLSFIGLLLIGLYLKSRLGQNNVHTYDAKSFKIIDSWSLFAKDTWLIYFSYVIVFIVNMLILLSVALLVFGLVLATGFGGIEQFVENFSHDMPKFLQENLIGFGVVIFLVSVLNVVTQLMFEGIALGAYKAKMTPKVVPPEAA